VEGEGVWGGRFTRDGNGERVSTGCGVLDGVFSVRTREGGGGGVERGVVLGVSGGDEGVLVCCISFLPISSSSPVLKFSAIERSSLLTQPLSPLFPFFLFCLKEQF